MDEDEDVSSKGQFARCIICSDYSIRTKCYNIFNTTLKNGKILLSEFLKNILDCTVLIVVSPEFFICKRCYTLCHNLDYSLARCNDLQGKIRTLFSDSERKLRLLRGEDNMNDPDVISGIEQQVDIKQEIEDEPYLDDEIQDDEMQGDEMEDDKVQEEIKEEEYYEEPLVNVKEIEDIDEMDPDFYLTNEIVESEVVVGDTDILAEEEETEDEAVTQIEVEQEQIKANKSQDMMMCEICGLCFESRETLKTHMKTECKKDMKSKIKSIYEFQNFSVKLKKKKKVFFCNRCTYETTTSTDITKHLKSHKTDPEYMCDICGRRFKFFKTFTRHAQVHDESRPFACKLCSFRAMTEVLLRIHERQHDDQKKYSCSKCGYKTLKKMSYLIHCRTHTGERPYCCPNCPYKAKDPSTLLRHRRIHGGIRRYQCTICEYKAVQKAALDVHMKTHTGEKPYACDQCDYRSSAKHNLKAHIAAIHSDEKPFACTQCSYRTKLKRLLTYHMRKHSGEKPFSCQHCGDRFRYRSALSYHLSRKHPVDQEGVVQTYYVLNYCESKKLKFNGEDLVFSDESDSENEVQ